MNKKTAFSSLLLTVAVALMTLSFSSCDPEEEYYYYSDAEYVRENLVGTWQGQISTYYRDRWGLTGSSYLTTLQFNWDYTGYEVDYDTYSPYSDYWYCPFTWYVSGNGTIVIHYSGSYDDTYIYDYNIGYSRFYGYMDDGYTDDISFSLSKVNDFYWDPYWSGYAKKQGE